MTKTFAALSIDGLRAEARALREQLSAKGIALRHTQALARTAEKYGYRSWEDLVAAMQLKRGNVESKTTEPSCPPPLEILKAEARALREQLAAQGTNLRHTRALARIAEKYGYRTWEALVAAQCDDD